MAVVDQRLPRGPIACVYFETLTVDWCLSTGVRSLWLSGPRVKLILILYCFDAVLLEVLSFLMTFLLPHWIKNLTEVL